MNDRARLYLHHIVEELERRGMPTELALLPAIESAYQPYALSRARAWPVAVHRPDRPPVRPEDELVVRRPPRRAGGHPGGAGLPGKTLQRIRRRLAPGAGRLQRRRRQDRAHDGLQPAARKIDRLCAPETEARDDQLRSQVAGPGEYHRQPGEVRHHTRPHLQQAVFRQGRNRVANRSRRGRQDDRHADHRPAGHQPGLYALGHRPRTARTTCWSRPTRKTP